MNLTWKAISQQEQLSALSSELKVVLIGHRGVGKTQLAKRLSVYSGYPIFDLDNEIEKLSGQSPQEIFSIKGEAAFRDLELKVFASAIALPGPLILVLGAGFDLSKASQLFPQILLSKELERENQKFSVLWVKRHQDRAKRIFVDRPRLNKDLAIEEDYYSRFSQREEIYSEFADMIYLMPEGLDAIQGELSTFSDWDKQSYLYDIERDLLLSFLGRKQLSFQKSPKRILTLLPWHFQRSRWKKLDQIFQGLVFELREDLLSPDQISEVLVKARNQTLYSFRKSEKALSEPTVKKELWRQSDLIDWEVSLGRIPESLRAHFSLNPKVRLILSSHTDKPPFLSESFSPDVIARTPFECFFKWSPLVKDFSDLERSHRWSKLGPHHIFCPRSVDGRWAWYRLRTFHSQPMVFFQMNDDFVADQPSLFEALMTVQSENFFAVLGDPVRFSFSPAEHADFVLSKNTNYLRVQINKEEWGQGFSFLRSLGLKGASVTSPLKQALTAEPCNTFYCHEGQVHTANTDEPGLEECLRAFKTEASFDVQKVAVWGAGAMRENIQRIFPQARFFHSRQESAEKFEAQRQELRECLKEATFWIWAAPPQASTPIDVLNRFEKKGSSVYASEPDQSWNLELDHSKLRWVWDLNYREDSLAKKFSIQMKAKYFSGLNLFKAQAIRQRIFWSRYE